MDEFGFDNNDDLVEKTLAKKQEEAMRYRQIVQDRARACLATEQFSEYRKGIKAAEEKTLDVLIHITKQYLSTGGLSVDVYAASMVRYITKLEDMRLLLTRVEKDKGPNKNV